ncbi:MAG: TRAP transporter substrate-binding protein [Deltaproteobacteria bacterium]|nr:TRAP transporter substrate-binding protein [Deltaproteobacteria bacterium]
MRKNRKILVGALVCFVVSFLLAPAYAKPIVIKIGHSSEGKMRFPGAGRTANVSVMKNYIESATNGEVVVEVHPLASLGNARSMLEQAQTGVIQMVGSYTSIMTPFAPEMAVTQIPFLFKDSLVAWKVMQGPFGDELANVFLKKTGLRVLCWPEGNGFRNLYTSGKVVKNPSDLKGIKVRVPENPGLLAMFRAFGAKTVTITWTELYTALQTGMADACETELYSADMVKLFEVMKTVTMTRHGYNLHPIMINEKFFQSLSKEHQKVIMRAAELGETVGNGFCRASEITTVEKLQKEGTKFYYPNDQELARFKKLGLQPYLDITKKKIGKDGQKWIDNIYAAVEKAEADIEKEYQSKAK